MTEIPVTEIPVTERQGVAYGGSGGPDLVVAGISEGLAVAVRTAELGLRVLVAETYPVGNGLLPALGLAFLAAGDLANSTAAAGDGYRAGGEPTP